jgi:hypothetical protein
VREKIEAVAGFTPSPLRSFTTLHYSLPSPETSGASDDDAARDPLSARPSRVVIASLISRIRHP